MIIHRLVEHYDDLMHAGKAPGYGWSIATVNLGILLAEDGTLRQLFSLNTQERMGKKDVDKPRSMIVPAHGVKAGTKITANFLCDGADYLLGVSAKETPEKLKQKFEVAKALHLELLSGVDCRFAKAICAFFETWDLETASQHPAVIAQMDALAEGRNLVFVMDGTNFSHDDTTLQNIWNAHYLGKKSENKQICLVTGTEQPIARIHDVKIKNIPGAQAAGANLISINSDAFISYNLAGNMPGAPIGEYSAFAYATALNLLLADYQHRFDLGDTRIVYWAKGADDTAANIVSNVFTPPPESDEHVLEEIFKQVKLGLAVQDIPLQTPFYILGVRPNAARVSVVLFLESTFGDILRNINAHHERMAMYRASSFARRSYLTPRDIVGEVVNTKSTDKKPNPQMMMGLLRSIFSNTNYPYMLFENVLMRVRADQKEQKITWGRASIIKACLLQFLSEEERKWIQMSLNTESKNKPYLLGRLFSVLEAAQKSANPEIKATIKDRFFNSACANPNLAFPQILKLFETHINKLEKDKPGFAINYQKAVREILSHLNVEDAPFPKALSLNDQGLFILGYYQQTQDRYTKKEEA